MSGLTNERGEFHYRDGRDRRRSSSAEWCSGRSTAAPRVNLAQLVNRADGKIDRLGDPIVTNLARFVQTLDQDGDGENGVTIAPIVHDLVGPMVMNFNQADTDAAKVAADDGAARITRTRPWSRSPATRRPRSPPTRWSPASSTSLNATPGVFTANTPRTLRNAAAARNELRRNIRGIIKLTDVRIPTPRRIVRLRRRLPSGR